MELVVGPYLVRPPRVEEASEALVMLTDPAVALWNPAPAVVDEVSAAAWCLRGADWASGTHATFSIVLAETGALVGNVSLHQIDREQRTADIGYRVVPHHRGRGAASQCVRAVTDWSFASLDLERVQLFHAVENGASCRVAENAGFRLEGTLRQATIYGDGRRHDTHLHAKLATDEATR